MVKHILVSMGLIKLVEVFLFVKKDSLNQLKAPQCSTQLLTMIYDLGRKKIIGIYIYIQTL